LHRLDAADRKAMLPVIGAEIDLRNIVWLYRLKEYYGVVGQAGCVRLIPVRYRLSSEVFQQMLTAEAGALLSVVKQGVYAGIFPDFLHPEMYVNRGLASAYARQTRLYQRGLAVVCRYFFARRMQDANIQTIHAGRQLGYPAAEIQKRLVIAW